MRETKSFYDVLVVAYLPSGKVGALETFTVEAGCDANNYCYKFGVKKAEELQKARPGMRWRYHESAPAGGLDQKVADLMVESVFNVLEEPEN